MLSRELMGVVALWILWVNALLVAGAAAKDALALGRRRAQMVPLRPDAGKGTGLDTVALVTGTLAQGEGEAGAIAAVWVDQVGRAAGEGETARIEFADRKVEARVFGGALSDGTEIQPAPNGEVWLDPKDFEKAGACESDAAFDAGFEAARKAKGFARTVKAAAVGQIPVFIFGQVRRRPKKAGSGDWTVVGPTTEGEMLLSTVDPRPLLGRKEQLAWAFIVAELTVTAGITLLGLNRPWFGVVSTIGGIAGLGFFLGVQPLGTMVRDAIKVPSQAAIRGRWDRKRA